MHAQSQSNAQAMFNLGYMHEHGQGLPLDLHLAKRYYDQALENDPAARLPVTLALTSLWIRKNYADTFLVSQLLLWFDLLLSLSLVHINTKRSSKFIYFFSNARTEFLLIKSHAYLF